jgi:hypothetical protein
VLEDLTAVMRGAFPSWRKNAAAIAVVAAYFLDITVDELDSETLQGSLSHSPDDEGVSSPGGCTYEAATFGTGRFLDIALECPDLDPKVLARGAQVRRGGETIRQNWHKILVSLDKALIRAIRESGRALEEGAASSPPAAQVATGEFASVSASEGDPGTGRHPRVQLSYGGRTAWITKAYEGHMQRIIDASYNGKGRGKRLPLSRKIWANMRRQLGELADTLLDRAGVGENKRRPKRVSVILKVDAKLVKLGGAAGGAAPVRPCEPLPTCPRGR